MYSYQKFLTSFTWCGHTSLEESTCVAIGLGGLIVLEETHPRLLKSLQTILESIHSTCIQCALIQTVTSLDESLGEKVPSHFQ